MRLYFHCLGNLQLDSWSENYGRFFSYYVSLLHVALFLNLISIINTILEQGIEIDLRDCFGLTPLSYAAQKGDPAFIMKILDRRDVNPNSQDKGGRTPLSYAVESGNRIIVRLLLDRERVDADLKDAGGRTPLFYATRSGHED